MQHYLLAAALGCCVGSIEILSRYRALPSATLRSWPTYFYILFHGAMAGVAFFLLTNVVDLTDERRVPPWVRTNLILMAIFSGLFYGLILRAKFLELRGSPSGRASSSIGTSFIFDRVLNIFESRIDADHMDAVRDHIAKLTHGKNLMNLGQYILKNINGSGYKTLSGEKAKRIQKEARDFMKITAANPNMPPLIAVSALALAIVDELGMRTFENLITSARETRKGGIWRRWSSVGYQRAQVALVTLGPSHRVASVAQGFRKMSRPRTAPACRGAAQRRPHARKNAVDL